MTELVMLSFGMRSSQHKVDSRWYGIRLEGLEPIDTDGDSRNGGAATAVRTPRWANLIWRNVVIRFLIAIYSSLSAAVREVLKHGKVINFAVAEG